MNKKKLSGLAALLLLSAGGFAAGVLNGLLGAGGGIIMIFTLELIYRKSGKETKDAFATVIGATLPISLVSAFIYARRGTLATDSFEPYILPAVVGGTIGAALLTKISAAWLKRIFGLLIIWSGIFMIFK